MDDDSTLLEFTIIPEKQPFTLDYTSIVGVSRVKRQPSNRYVTIIYIGSLSEYIEVAESYQEVVELWKAKVNFDPSVGFSEDEGSFDDEETEEDNENDSTKT